MKFLMEAKVKNINNHRREEKVVKEKPIDLGLLDSTKHMSKVNTLFYIYQCSGAVVSASNMSRSPASARVQISIIKEVKRTVRNFHYFDFLFRFFQTFLS